MAICALLALSALSPQAEWKETQARLAEVVETWHRAGQFDGTVHLVHRGNAWTHSVGWAIREEQVPHRPTTRYPIASITKQLTAVLVLQAVERGEIELEAPITAYLPDYPEDPGERISVRSLLSHTSGLPEPPVELYLQDLKEDQDLGWIVATHGAGKPTFEVDTDFAYSNTDYFLLGAILEQVSGLSYEELLEREILEPLGMENTGLARREGELTQAVRDYASADGAWVAAPPFRWSNWQSAGGLYSTVGDLSRWNRALFEHELLSPETTALMLTPRTDVGSTGNYVALGSWVYPRKLPGSDQAPTLIERRGAIGGFTALNVLVKGEETWLVILSNHYNEQIHQLPWGSSMPLDLLLALYGLEPEGPPK